MFKFPISMKRLMHKMTIALSRWFDSGVVKSRRAGKSGRRLGGISLRIGGSVNKSIVIAARDVVLQPGVGIGLGMTLVAGVGLLMMVLAGISAIQMDNKMARFVQGDDLKLDLVILPLEPAGTNDVCARRGRDISNQIATSVSRQLQLSELDDVSTGILVWGPDQVDRLQVATGQSYDQAVAAFAVATEADIVLYGSVQCDAQSITIYSHFYLAASEDKEMLNLLGAYDFDLLTSNISERYDRVAAARIDAFLSDRARVIALLSQAFQYYNHHTREDYLKSAELLEQAEGPLQRAESPLQRADGLDGLNGDAPMLAVVQVFIGNAYTRAATDDCSNRIDGALLTAAVEHYTKAIQFDPQSARAYLGLAVTMNSFAMRETDLWQAQQYVNMARDYLAMAYRNLAYPLNKVLEWYIRFADVQSRLIEHDITADPQVQALLLREADNQAHQLIEQYEQYGAANKLQLMVAAYAYAVAGQIQEYYTNTSAALAFYQESQRIAQAGVGQLKVQMGLAVARVQTELGDACAAAAQYEGVLKLKSGVCESDKNDIEQRLKESQVECRSGGMER